MPSGSVTLLEASRLETNNQMLGRGVVKTIIQESPLLAMLPMLTLNGEAYVSRHEKVLPDVEFRKVNETYTRSFGTFDKQYWGVSILGGEVFVDNFLVRTRSGGDNNVKARQFVAKARAAALTYDKYVIDGTGSADDFKGFNQLITEGFGQYLANAANGGVLALAKLDEAIDLNRSGTPDAMLLNRTVRRQVTDLGRNLSNGFSLIDVGNDAFGRQVSAYDGIPMKIIGDDQTGAQILGFDETQGSSSVSSSIYLPVFGDEENVFGIMGAGGSMEVKDFGETEAAPGHMGRIEFYPGIAVLSKYGLVRLGGIEAA